MGTGDETVTALKTEVSPSPRNILKCLKCISSEENDTKLAVEIPNRGDQLRKCIVGIIAWRESCLDALLLDYPGLVRLAPTIESSTGKVLNQFLDKLRYLSIEIVEKTCEWRKLTGMEQAPLLFEGENYLLKMITDLDFCDQASDVRSPWWGSSMARNPFLLLDAASEPAPLLGVDPTSTTAVGGVDKLRVVNCTRVLESEQQRHGNLTNFPTSPWSNRGATNTDNSAFPISNYNGDDEPGQGPAMSPSSSLQPLTEPRKKSLQQPKPPLDLGGVEVQRRHKRGSAGKETVSGGQPRPRRTRQLIANGSRASNPRCSTTTKEHHPKRTKIKRNMSLSVGSAFPITPSDLYSNPQGSRPHPKGDRASLSTPTLASIHGDKTDTTLNSYRPQNGPRFPDPVVVSLGRVRSRSHLGAEPYRPLSLMDQPPPPLLSTSNSLDDPSQPSYFPLLQSTESDPPGGSGEGGG